MAFACYIRSTKRTNSQRYSYRDRRAHTRPRSRQTPRPVVTNPDSSRRDNSFVSDDDNDPDHSVVAPGSFAASCLDRLRLSARAWLSFLRWSGVIAFRRAFDRSFSAARCSSVDVFLGVRPPPPTAFTANGPAGRMGLNRATSPLATKSSPFAPAASATASTKVPSPDASASAPAGFGSASALRFGDGRVPSALRSLRRVARFVACVCF